MGRNVMSACHECEEKVFHYRGRENDTILPFYKAHSRCMVHNPNNVVTLDDQYQEEDWMHDDSNYTEWQP